MSRRSGSRLLPPPWTPEGGEDDTRSAGGRRTDPSETSTRCTPTARARTHTHTASPRARRQLGVEARRTLRQRAGTFHLKNATAPRVFSRQNDPHSETTGRSVTQVLLLVSGSPSPTAALTNPGDVKSEPTPPEKVAAAPSRSSISQFLFPPRSQLLAAASVTSCAVANHARTVVRCQRRRR